MKLYFCDNCKKETDSVKQTPSNDFEYPSNWITTKGGIIINDTDKAKLHYCGGKEMNFCSKECFIDNYFK